MASSVRSISFRLNSSTNTNSNTNFNSNFNTNFNCRRSSNDMVTTPSKQRNLSSPSAYALAKTPTHSSNCLSAAYPSRRFPDAKQGTFMATGSPRQRRSPMASLTHKLHREFSLQSSPKAMSPFSSPLSPKDSSIGSNSTSNFNSSSSTNINIKTCNGRGEGNHRSSSSLMNSFLAEDPASNVFLNHRSKRSSS